MTPQEIYIPVDSQELANELKEICIKYSLPIWDDEIAFVFDKYATYNLFIFSSAIKRFAVFCTKDLPTNKTQITKEQFIELLDNIKK